jgi:hypothetical protein
VTTLEPDAPWTIVRVAGEAVRLKLGAGVTVRLIVAVLVRLPELPVTVTVAVPVVADALALSVSTLVSATVPFAKEAVTPAGKPEAASATVPLKPFTPLTVIVVVLPVAPCARLSVVGEAEMV